MKRSILFALAVTLLAACSTKEIDIRTPVQDDVVFYASFEQPGDEGARVYANEDLLLRWTADDRVSIFNKLTYNQEYKFTGQTGANTGEFKKVDNDEVVTGNAISHVVSVYPYREATTITESEVIGLTLPAEQTYAENTFGLGANTMVSVSEDNVLQYKNVCGYLMIKLYGDDVKVKSITLRGNHGEKIAGAASVSISEGEDPTTVMASDATAEITLACPEPVSIGTSSSDYNPFWFAIPPVEFTEGFTIVVEGDHGGSFTKTTGKSLVITRSYAQKMAPIEVVITNAVVIDAEGGEYSLAGCRIEVPAGAVQEETEISIEKLEDAPEGSPEAEGLVAVYEFSPSGTTFQTPISVSFPMPDAADGTPVTLLYLNPEENHWQACGESTVSGGTVTFQLSHFSTYALASGSSPVLPDYLCFTSQQDGSTIGISNNGNSRPNVEFSFDGSVWNDWDYSDITLDSGKKVYMRGNNPGGFTSFEVIHTTPNGLDNEVGPNLSTFTMSGKIAASGNVMSLLYPDDFENQDSLPADGCFGALFMGCSALTSAPELPATSLTNSCYYAMFGYCSNLVSAPELPATDLAEDCYASMFYGCSALTEAPELPAKNLAIRCYGAMFSECKALQVGPDLDATDLKMGCYHNMFYGSGLTKAPDLPATVLVDLCYYYMFSECEDLSDIKMLAMDISAVDCLTGWMDNVASTGTFVMNSQATWDPRSYGVPSGWTVIL